MKHLALAAALAVLPALAWGQTYPFPNAPYAGEKGTGAPSTSDQILVQQGVTSHDPVGSPARMTLGTLGSVIGGGISVTATGSTTARLLPDWVSVPANVKAFGAVCDGTTNVASAVNAAVASGAKLIFLPRNCLYIPTSNTTPAGVEIDGEDWNTSTISVANRATDGLQMGARSVLKNVAIVSQFCDATANPPGTQKVCPVGEARNNSDSTNPLTNWVYETLFAVSGPQVTGPTGVVSTDIPQLSCETSAPGADCQYISTGAALASGLRIVTSASPGADNGIYILNGFMDATTTDSHYGIFAKEMSNSSATSVGTIRVDRFGDGTNVSSSLEIDDTDATGSTYTRPYVSLVSGHQSSGQFINLFQGGTPYSGSAIQMNMGNASGTFTGNFLLLQLAGANKFLVDSTGSITASGGATFTGFMNFQSSSGWLGSSSANYLAWSSQGAGVSPVLKALGSDTNISLRLLGKGANGVLQGSFTSTVDPTTTDIPAGTCADWNNTTAATYKHVCNFGGALKSVSMN